ncbi:DUF2202 domain-containing protein [bacterium]|nr:DUF2202 domain-containing protein [bacterium]
MKRRQFLTIAGMNMLLAACGNQALDGLAAPNSGTSLDPNPVTDEDMDLLISSGHVSTEALQFIREEEKLARDVYIALFNIWKLPVFDNIAASEQVHTDRIKFLLDKYSIEDPAATTEIGEFKNTTIQKYYDDLVDRGSKSALEALHVGGYIEELDIGDLRHEIELANSQDVINVYTNLVNGSYNHLRSFVGQIEKQGVTYKAQLLEQSDVDSIVASGGSNGSGGKGRA